MTDHASPPTLHLHTSRWTADKRFKYAHYVQQRDGCQTPLAHANNAAADSNTTPSLELCEHDTIQPGCHIFITTHHSSTFGTVGNAKSRLRIHKTYTDC